MKHLLVDEQSAQMLTLIALKHIFTDILGIWKTYERILGKNTMSSNLKSWPTYNTSLKGLIFERTCTSTLN